MCIDEACPGGITSVLLPSHQKYVTVREWLGKTTAVMFTSLFLMTTKGATSWTCSTGPRTCLRKRQHKSYHNILYMAPGNEAN